LPISRLQHSPTFIQTKQIVVMTPRRSPTVRRRLPRLHESVFAIATADRTADVKRLSFCRSKSVRENESRRPASTTGNSGAAKALIQRKQAGSYFRILGNIILPFFESSRRFEIMMSDVIVW
jgi:hypothetical protein